MNFREIIAAQRLYVTKRWGKAVAQKTEYGIGTDTFESYVESVVIGLKWKHLLTTYVTDADGKTSNKHFTGKPNSLKHVTSVLGERGDQ